MFQRVCFVFLIPLAVFGSDYDIVINEIAYNPLEGGSRAEFIELFNRGGGFVDLTGWKIAAGVDFTFPPGTVIPPREYLLVAGDPAYMEEAFGVTAAGPWTGRLADDGERIIVRRADGMVVDLVHYDDGGLWPGRADGEGATLELEDPFADNDSPSVWHSSAVVGGTPGRANGPPPGSSGVRINEIGREGTGGWVELVNRTGEPVDVTGYVVVTGTELDLSQVLGAGEVSDLAVFSLSFVPPAGRSRFLLLAPDRRTIVDCFHARLSDSAESTGRWPDGAGEVYAFSKAGPDLPNERPVDDSIYISEIMYHPPHMGVPPEEPLGLEYVAVANRGESAVDLTAWYFSRGISFTFPEGVVINPGEELVIAKDAALFSSRYPEVSNVLGDFSGKLVNSSEKIRLRDAGGNLIDEVDYADDGPWPREADGEGAALVLRTSDPAFDNAVAGAWKAVFGGTPGTAPEKISIPPVCEHAVHDPAVPRSTDLVLVTCRLFSGSEMMSAELRFRSDGGGAFTVPLHDDGAHGDGAEGDGVWGARIGPFPAGTVVAYHVIAANDAGSSDSPGPGKDYLFVVDDTAEPGGNARPYRIICTASTWNLLNRDVWSNELRDATFIGEKGEIRYNVGFRFRGSSARERNPKSYRVQFRDADLFHGMKRLNLNRVRPESQILAWDFVRRAGLPYARTWPVALWIHGTWDRFYLRVEAVDRDFLKRFFGAESDGGILYRGWESDELYRSAGFTYYGPDPESYRPLYENVTGDWANDDYEEVIELCKVFSPEFTDDAAFPTALEERIDVDQWLLFFAAQACLSNDEAGLANDRGDDYFVYFRPGDGKAVLIPWDFDTCFHSASEELFRPTVAAIHRFLRHPAFAPGYYAWLKKLREGPFSPQEMRRRVGIAAPLCSTSRLTAIENYFIERAGYLDRHIPAAVRGGVADIPERKLVAEGDVWRYFKGTADPSGGDLSWTEPDFDDSSWQTGPSGFGYEDLDDATVLSDMRGNYTTIFIRRRFTVADPGALKKLTFRIDYDDGFAAYLNGGFLAARRAPSGIPRYTWQATGLHEAGTPENIDVSSFIPRLVAGENVLAVVGLNYGIESTDLSLIPELVLDREEVSGGGVGDVCFATGDTVTLKGIVPAIETRRLEINGSEVSYDPVWASWENTVPVATGRNLVEVCAFDQAGDVVDRTTFTVYRVGGVHRLTGSLAEDMTLTAAGGPYEIAGTLTVPAGRRLTIEPGVTILGCEGASLLVNGEMEAVGTESEPIRFTSSTKALPWLGIAIRNTGTAGDSPVHVFRNCLFIAGSRRGDSKGFIDIRNSRVLVERCRFEEQSCASVYAAGSLVTLNDCSFARVLRALSAESSSVTISDTVFREVWARGACVSLAGDGPERCVIERSFFENAVDCGLALNAVGCSMRDCRFRGCEGTALTVSGTGSLGKVSLSGSILWRNGTALALGSCEAEVVHATFVANGEGFRIESGGTLSLSDSIVWHNTVNFTLSESAGVSVSYSDVEGEEVPSGEGNLACDPAFQNEKECDFALTLLSPCLRAAHDGTDMGAVPHEGVLPMFVRGDADGDGSARLNDVMLILEWLFAHGDRPDCLDALDVNDNGMITISDAVALLSYLFRNGRPPPEPFPDPGLDRTADSLSCERLSP